MSSLGQTSIYRTKSPFIKLLLPILFLLMVGSYITFLQAISTSNTRWLFLFSLLFFLLLKKNFLQYFDSTLAFFLLIYMSWCFFTSAWSAVPILSFLKSTVLMVTVLTMIRAGIEWVKNFPIEKSLDYVWMLTIVTLMAGFLGKYTLDATNSGPNQVEFYEGLVKGSNMFGMLLAMCFPFLLWKTYSEWSNKIRRLIWTAIIVSSIYFIVISMSRAAMVATVITVLFFLLSINLKKKIKLILTTFFILAFAILISPSIITKISNLVIKSVYKTELPTDNTSIFQSRKGVWQDSYEGAVEGGWLGLGYGVAFGKTDFNFDDGLTAQSYGRERGNSQLAIIEETGLIGFFLYLALLTMLLIKLINMYLRTRNPDHKVLVGILTGIFFGMIFHSVFEGWWDSPGGPETLFFWLLVGTIRGVEISLLKKRVTYAAS